MEKRYTLIYSEVDGRHHILDRELKQLLFCYWLKDLDEKPDNLCINLWFNKDDEERFVKKSELKRGETTADNYFRIESYSELKDIDDIEDVLMRAFEYQ